MSPTFNNDTCRGKWTPGSSIPFGCYMLDGMIYEHERFVGQQTSKSLARPNPFEAKQPTPKPSPPPGPPATGSQKWAAELIAKYGKADGVKYMTRELSLADAAKEHAAQLAKLAELKAEHSRLTAELARQERRKQGKGVRFAQVCRIGGKHPQRPKPPSKPAA
jgi:hypothetical protein